MVIIGGLIGWEWLFFKIDTFGYKVCFDALPHWTSQTFSASSKPLIAPFGHYYPTTESVVQTIPWSTDLVLTLDWDCVLSI